MSIRAQAKSDPLPGASKRPATTAGQRLLALGRAVRSLLYPTLCLNCCRPVTDEQSPQLCVSCASRLALTRYWEIPVNPVTDTLLGRLDVEMGVGLYHFTTDSVCQSLIHALKYHRRPDIGVQLGRQLGGYLADHPQLHDLYGIVPVPIHPARRHTRGYNQAEKIAEGLAEVLNVPTFHHALRRTSFRGSQTKKNRHERLDNVRRAFAPGEGNFSGKHLLLVDDVITTGATLDFCGNLLQQRFPDGKLSIATLAAAG